MAEQIEEENSKPRFCPQCGADASGVDRFCNKCGFDFASVKDEPRPATSTNPPQPQTAMSNAEAAKAALTARANTGVPGQVVAVATKGAGGSLSSQRTKIIIAAAIALVVVISIVIFFVVDSQQKARSNELSELANKTYPVSINLQVPNWDAKASTPIPMAIEGTDFTGAAVHEIFLYDGTAEAPVNLKRGKYQAYVTTSPINQAGGIYSVPAKSVAIDIVDADVESKLSQENRDDLKGDDASREPASGHELLDTGSALELEPIDPIDETDDLINAAYDGLVAAGYDKSKAGEFKKKAEEVHADAVERAEARADFEQRLSTLESRIDTLDRGMGPGGKMTTAQGVEATNAVSDVYDPLMSDLYSYVRSITSANELDALEASQEAFDSEIQAIKNKWTEQRKASGSNHPTLTISCYREQMDVAVPRIRELISMIQ